MGILFNTNTWRAPLQLIDCWLPEPSSHRAIAANEPLTTRAMQRFTRAGWMGKRASTLPATDRRAAATVAHATARTSCGLRVLRQTEPLLPSRSGGLRLVISGPIDDVCAELDRLADQETQLSTRVA